LFSHLHQSFPHPHWSFTHLTSVLEANDAVDADTDANAAAIDDDD